MLFLEGICGVNNQYSWIPRSRLQLDGMCPRVGPQIIRHEHEHSKDRSLAGAGEEDRQNIGAIE